MHQIAYLYDGFVEVPVRGGFEYRLQDGEVLWAVVSILLLARGREVQDVSLNENKYQGNQEITEVTFLPDVSCN